MTTLWNSDFSWPLRRYSLVATAELRDRLAAREVAHLRIARQPSGQQDLVHGPSLLPGRPALAGRPCVGRECGGDANRSGRRSPRPYLALIRRSIGAPGSTSACHDAHDVLVPGGSPDRFRSPASHPALTSTCAGGAPHQAAAGARHSTHPAAPRGRRRFGVAGDGIGPRCARRADPVLGVRLGRGAGSRGDSWRRIRARSPGGASSTSRRGAGSSPWPPCWRARPRSPRRTSIRLRRPPSGSTREPTARASRSLGVTCSTTSRQTSTCCSRPTRGTKARWRSVSCRGFAPRRSAAHACLGRPGSPLSAAQ